MSLCFEYSFKPGTDPADIYALALETRLPSDDDYVRETFFGIILNLEFIDSQITAYSNGWKTSRISPVALAIMRTAIYEIYYRDDVPDAAAINEAVELVREFDDEGKVRPFVNGVLNAVLKNKPSPEGQ